MVVRIPRKARVEERSEERFQTNNFLIFKIFPQGKVKVLLELPEESFTLNKEVQADLSPVGGRGCGRLLSFFRHVCICI
jgi:hypothetical protein